jgi:hypothetical protein
MVNGLHLECQCRRGKIDTKLSPRTLRPLSLAGGLIVRANAMIDNVFRLECKWDTGSHAATDFGVACRRWWQRPPPLWRTNCSGCLSGRNVFQSDDELVLPRAALGSSSCRGSRMGKLGYKTGCYQRDFRLYQWHLPQQWFTWIC